ncbi:VOC family protein [Actinoplanes sichuanensis]|uniref:VOC family protein n=1 Tax=Actinoplanes sichuanensis TaxID=512349 RepID=A0ABW4APF0_9ACTN|nr:VOC family protein [Actinoplanes sichuanensis]BEL06848.1 VOC family protein [Actinoplanes sichuanensis]
MTSRFTQWTLDVHDLARQAEFWSAALGYTVDFGDDGDAHLWPPAGGLSVWLQPTTAPKSGKNRNHPDLVVADGDVDAEVARLLALGATPVDVGQTGDEGFTVLADPEGNEFCLLHVADRGPGRYGSDS